MKNKLEEWVADWLVDIDPDARPTKASGACTEIGDVLNHFFYIECKQRSTKNITINMDVWNKLLSQCANPNKLPLYVNENKSGERFVTMDAVDFFTMYKKFKEMEYRGDESIFEEE